MRIDFAGASWRCSDPAGLVAELESKPPIAQQRYVLGCEGCKELCTIERPCRCCDNIGTKAGGTGRIVRGIQNSHSRLAADEIISRLRSAAA